MKELEIEAVKDLTKFYEEYLDKGNTKEIKKKAMVLEGKYLHCSPLVHKDILQAVGHLVNFYATGIPHGKIPDKEEAKELLAKLKKLKEELEN
jgi:hypothetical protein